MSVLQAHFIDNEDNRIISKRTISVVPRVGDELRFGGLDREVYYKVILVVFVYDEPLDRVNIGCELTALEADK